MEGIMTKRFLALLVAAAFGSALAVSGCKKAEAPAPVPTAAPVAEMPTIPAPAVAVVDVQLGNALGPDKKVQASTDTFKPKDTIFAVISTEGAAPAAVIAVKWTYQDGQTVKEDSRTIAPTGPATTEFSIQKPSGWPKGGYKVETTVDGKPGPSKSFKVQ
jgi:Flp pilus assembly protein CpaB